MNLKPFADMGWAVGVAIIGLGTLLFAAPITILMEAYFIWKSLNISFWRSVRDSIVMNLVSGILGLIALVVLGPNLPIFALEAQYYSPPQEVITLALLSLLGPACLISILVEGLVLSMMERNSPKWTIWLITLLSNLTSYAGMFVVDLLFF